MANYLHLAIYLVCFYDALVMLCLPSSATFILAEDGSAAQLVSVLTALGIGLCALYIYGFKKLENIWMAIILFFIVFSSFHSPNITFESIFTPKDPGLFNYKPMFECLVYFLMFLGICAIELTPEQRYKVESSISWTGILYSAYIILQHCGFDQIYHIVGTAICQLSRNPLDGGFISQPVFAAALLVVCFPFVMRYKPGYLYLLPIALLLTGNRSALVAGAVMVVFLLTSNRKLVFSIIGAYVAVLALIMGMYLHDTNIEYHFNTSGRLMTWAQVGYDFFHPAFPGVHKSFILTGLGIGAYPVTFPFYNHSVYYQAHNEYLEIFYGLSFIGLFLFLKMQSHIFRTSKNQCITAALIGISVFAITNPVWHRPVLQFVTVFLIGLAYNEGVQYGVGIRSTR